MYGDAIDLPVAEDQPLLAVNAYGASKITGRSILPSVSPNLQTELCRIAPRQRVRTTRRGARDPLWLDRAAAGLDLEIYGGNQLIDFIWIDQVVNASMRAAKVPSALPPINIGSGTGTRVVDLARRIIRLNGGRSRISVRQSRPVEVTRFVANVSRMQQMLQVQRPEDPLAYLDLMVEPIGAPVRERLPWPEAQVALSIPSSTSTRPAQSRSRQRY